MQVVAGNRNCGDPKCREATGSNAAVAVAGDLGNPAVQEPSSQALAAARRTDTLRQRLGITPAATSTSYSASGPTNSAPVDHLKGLIGWQVRIKGAIDHSFGGAVTEWNLSAYMSDIYNAILTIMNVYWTRNGFQEPLTAQEVIMRWSGNRTFAVDDTLTLTFGELYARHNTTGQVNASLGPKSAPPLFQKQVNGKKCPVMFIEMFVDKSSYEARVNADNTAYSSPNSMLQSTLRSVAKRPRSASSAIQAGGPSKKVGASHLGPFNLTSEFRPRSRASNLPLPSEKSKVQVRKFVSVADNITGSTELIDLDEELSGLLSARPFSHGTMKVAYDFFDISAGKQFVMKRFFRVDEDAEVNMANPGASFVDPTQHNDKIIEEAHRLSEGAWFLKEFFNAFKAAHSNVDIDKNIQFASAFLLQEAGDTPSKASGLPEDYIGIGMTWLVEEKRPMAVTKFSGTLQHSSGRRDITSQTVYAFTHFVYLKSKGTMVFADVQGTLTDINGNDVMVLFDIMTHTSNEDSGIGDWGKTGMKAFLDGHQCGNICTSMGLDKMTIQDGEIVEEGKAREVEEEDDD